MQTHSQVANQSRAQAKTSTTAAGSFFRKDRTQTPACSVLAFTSTLRNKKKKKKKKGSGTNRLFGRVGGSEIIFFFFLTLAQVKRYEVKGVRRPQKSCFFFSLFLLF